MDNERKSDDSSADEAVHHQNQLYADLEKRYKNLLELGDDVAEMRATNKRPKKIIEQLVDEVTEYLLAIDDENEARNEPSQPRVKPASRSMRTKVAAAVKTSKAAVPTPATAASSESEDDVVSPPRRGVKPAPKSKASKMLKTGTRVKPAPTLKAKIRTPSSSPAVRMTRSKTAKRKATNNNNNNVIEPVASTSKAANSKISRTDVTHDEKLKKATTSVMVTTALASLPSRKGVSLAAIKKYIDEHYDVVLHSYVKRINNYLKQSVEAGDIIQLTGKGANGSFRLAPFPKTSKKRTSYTVLSTKRKSRSAPTPTRRGQGK